jgi:hypothetical protein
MYFIDEKMEDLFNDIETVLKEIASIPIPEYHDRISTAMHKDTIMKARRILEEIDERRTLPTPSDGSN